MIKITGTLIGAEGFESAIRGMRNPWNSWDRIDSLYNIYGDYEIGESDLTLMKKLIKAGTDHRKFLRMITIWCDITAPLYWWKEFDTYKVGTVANSCSTMHCIANKEFTVDDFSHEHLNATSVNSLKRTVEYLNSQREIYINKTNVNPKGLWWQMIQLLPSSYNQKRTVMLNYEVLMNIYKARKNHKLDEWREFCKWVEKLPYMKELLEVLNEKSDNKSEKI